VVGVDLQNVGIEGEGVIDGRGAALKAQQILTDNRPEGQRWGRRPFLLRLVRCEHVHIQGVTLNYSAAWTSHYYHCKQVTIQHIKIVSRGVAHNDGIDIDGCQNVNISDSDIDSGDDALCFKTTSSEMPCSGIRVSGLKLKSNQGAIKIGTESMAAFQDIKISNCYIYNTNNGGIKLLTVDGAHLNNVEISGITMVNVKTPILIRLGSRLSVFRKDQDKQQPTGTLENVTIRNIKAKAADTAQLKPPTGILITGVPGHPIKNLRLENIEIDLAGGGTVADSKQEVPEAIDKYPEVKTFGPLIPAYGIWARHVEGLQLINVRFNLKSNEERPAIICDDAKQIHITNCIFPHTMGSPAIIQFKQADDAVINQNKVAGVAGAFISTDNARSKISYQGNKIPAALKMIDPGQE
jgi:polygalacturonase